MKTISALFVLIFSQTAVSQKTDLISSSYLIDNHGIGFGAGHIQDKGAGHLQVHYDYNFDSSNQIHFTLGHAFVGRSNKGGDPVFRLNRTVLGTTYRKVFPYGFFLGSGLEVAQRHFEYYDSFTAENRSFKQTSFSYSLVADLGWQGNDGYYFTIGYNPSVYLVKPKDYSEDRIVDAYGWRETIEKDYEAFNRTGGFYISFGWYLV